MTCDETFTTSADFLFSAYTEKILYGNGQTGPAITVCGFRARKGFVTLDSRAFLLAGGTMARRKYFNRTKILERDEGQCQDCGATDNLEIHHIDGNPSNNHPSNAKTVCKDCHRKYTNQQLKEIAEQRAIESDKAQQERLDQIHANDALIEQAALKAWCDQGGSRRDWGGSEFHKFLREFIENT